MVMWVFGYGSLVWNPGFAYDARLVGFVRDYRRVFYQGSTDHRGTPEFPGRTVTLEHQPGSTCWGVAYKISREQDKQTALEYLEVREKQYDEKVYLDLYTDSSPKIPEVQDMMVYLATTNKEANQNYLGPAPLEEMAKQIYLAEGPTGPNKEYLFKLEDALNKIGMVVIYIFCSYIKSASVFLSYVFMAGVVDQHVQDLANAVRKYA
uniref:glutathione-specific gamma-glutamylcyclotransferase n=1 Tax=Aegilops tauschii subsp. strangulata TaxID=200361 RepID=A0A453C2Y7_AEGTS